MKKSTLFGISLLIVLFAATSCSNKSVELRLLKREVKKNPNSVQSHNNLAFYYDRYNECDKAIEEYKISLQLRPNDFLARNNMAQCYYKLKKYGEALVIFEKLVNEYPENSIIHSNLAMTYHGMGRYDDASLEYQKALEINPNNKPAKDGYEMFKEEIQKKNIKLKEK